MMSHNIDRRTALKGLGALGAVSVAGVSPALADGDEAEVKFSNQEAHHNRVVFVDEAKLPEGGFVVIHHITESDQDSGDDPEGAGNFQVIGHTPALRPGEYENLPVRLHDDSHHSLNGPVPADGSGDHVLLAMAHYDDPHDGEYTFPNGDPPYFDEDGNVVATPAVVTF